MAKREPISPLEIVAMDINAEFLDLAERGLYPAELLEGMTLAERRWFEVSEGQIWVPDAARRMVQFLPPMSFVDGHPGSAFDAVMVMNAFTYVTPEEQTAALAKIEGSARHLIAATAFHPDRIGSDLESIGFAPCFGGSPGHSRGLGRSAERRTDSAGFT